MWRSSKRRSTEAEYEPGQKTEPDADEACLLQRSPQGFDIDAECGHYQGPSGAMRQLQPEMQARAAPGDGDRPSSWISVCEAPPIGNRISALRSGTLMQSVPSVVLPGLNSLRWILFPSDESLGYYH